MSRGDEAREILGEWLRRRREPVDTLLEGSGVAGSTLRAWMAGRVLEPRADSLRAVADEIERRAGADLATARQLRQLLDDDGTRGSPLG
jgi:hypothetical protein